MVRSYGTVARPTTNGHLHNGEPPQSTLAAQLLHRLDGEQRGSNRDEGTFRQLLQEVLDVHREPSSTAVSVDNDVTNYKLIFVIVKAGLDPLTRDDPFSGHDEQIQLALDSIKAIDVTLKQTPALLTTTLEEDVQSPVSGTPMLFWLLPKLMHLLSLQRSDTVKTACGRCLRDVLVMETKVHLKGCKSKPLLRYLQTAVTGKPCGYGRFRACTEIRLEDIIGQIEMSQGSSTNPSSFFSFPSRESLPPILSTSEQSLDQFKDVTATVKGVGTAVIALASLMRVLAEFVSFQQERHTSSLRKMALIHWITHTFGRMWRVCEPIDAGGKGLTTASFDLCSLDVCMCLLPMPPKLASHAGAEAFIVSSDFLLQFLTRTPAPFDQDVERKLCTSLIGVAYYVANAKILERQRACTSPIMSFYSLQPERYENIDGDTKVR